MNTFDTNFWNHRRVLITGHTGFKGSWLSLLLHHLGAEVHGYALDPPTEPSLYVQGNIEQLVNSTIADIRDYEKLLAVCRKVNPEIVIHMAAQPLVMESYRNPRETYEINVMGTVNLLEALRNISGVKAVLNVTTDKCYENKEWIWGYRENEPMGGYDPYSNSKGCSELVTSAFRNSYFNPNDYLKHGVALASARAGNVIGGGDWAADRLIPDFLRSIIKGEKLLIRSPQAIRPWQHVLEPLSGYLLLCEKLFKEGPGFAEPWNFGPDENDAKDVAWITRHLCSLWGNEAKWEIDAHPMPHEATCLRLDCSKAKQRLQWVPSWDIETSLKSIVNWTKGYIAGEDVRALCLDQIGKYFMSEKA
ncbi:MAG: CDP-glucose 4,6-dehydratase [Bacteroidota bacterium]